MKVTKLGCGALVLLAGLGLTAPASAYCLTTTCDPETEGEADSCQAVGGCFVGGRPLFWASPCISFSVQKDGSRRLGISAEEASAAIGAGFTQWMRAECEQGGQPQLRVYELSPVECTRQEYNQDQPNANVWVFRDEGWPYDDSGTLALTTVTYNVDSGEIYDADVEINSFENVITIDDATEDFDLRSIATHEAGHVLGLSHSNDSSATMYAEYGPALLTARALDIDDVRGICAAIPPGDVPDACNPEPRHGFSSECASTDSGCSARPAANTAERGGLAALLVTLFGVAMLRSRRRRPRPGPSSSRGA